MYLSPDAEEVLEEIDESMVYVIGGLVDRTVAKRASMELAASVGVQVTIQPRGFKVFRGVSST